ncbi:MBL fold metallo-hydrolase [Lentilitoribacter sp. EG35]|uniref:MBL fold metallo-hydrolase n=1 Tax=Lentilitoribacter sp. EG35 TaxID=3234192 RepID=UPI00346053B2
MSTLTFNTKFKPNHGNVTELDDGIYRITANNRGPMTFEGTNTYLIGKENMAIIDPGPFDSDHLKVILNALEGRPLSHIFVSHTHKDHSPLAKELQSLTGATIYAEGPHRAARSLQAGENNLLTESSDLDFSPDVELSHGQIIDGGDWQIQAVHTPGHTANHCAFAYLERETLFSADHVMAWSTSFIGPPDGSMSDYMTSLKILIDRDDRHILPGHGPEVIAPKDFLLGLQKHRKSREQAILEAIKANDSLLISEIIGLVYQNLDERLKLAASLSTLAHLEDLVEQGEIKTNDTVSLKSRYQRV